MAKRTLRDNQASYEAWSLDQLTRSEFFHEKLHEWQLVEVARQIEAIRGETLEWDLAKLGITPAAWNKVVHSPIMPVIVFAHPDVLQIIQRAVSYYCMLSMVSQKSMNNIGLTVNRYESGSADPDDEHALSIARRLNQVISSLLQTDADLDPREFDLWRGMAAGAQAQGSWGNLKGKRAEIQVKEVLRLYLRNEGMVAAENLGGLELIDGRIIKFADEPDIAIYLHGVIQAAVEIKGGIDTAAILERVGAAVKSLSRAREENPESCTILLVPQVAMTDTALTDLEINRESVNHWFTVEAFLEDQDTRQRIFELLGV